MAFLILIILICGIIMIIDNISIESNKQKKIEDSNEIQKIRGIVLEVYNDTAILDGGREYKLTPEAKNTMLLKKWSNIYINKTSNEIVKIEWEEQTGI